MHDSRESSPLVAADGGAPTAYRRTVSLPDGGAWVQYWLYYRYQDQDRGVLRSGRHEGDWELVQFRVTASGRPVEAVYAQHSGAERCPASALTLRGGRPVVFASHGSHASYLRAGVRDRLWPDPNDEADGRGLVVRPRVVEIIGDLAAVHAALDALGRLAGRVVRCRSSSPRRPVPPSSPIAGTTRRRSPPPPGRARRTATPSASATGPRRR